MTLSLFINHPTITDIDVCTHLTQDMETNFMDVLVEGETTVQFIESMAKGRGMAERAREYVRPIAIRYVKAHQTHLFQLQAARRDPDFTTVVNASVNVPTPHADNIFNDDEWTKELDGIEVQELEGEWRKVTVFRNRGRPSHVCLWFGGDEYEGIDPRRPYAYDSRTECLEDDEGFDIHWRTVGVDQSDSEDSDDDEE